MHVRLQFKLKEIIAIIDTKIFGNMALENQSMKPESSS